MKNKPYPYYDVPELSDLKEFVAYCGDVFADRTAFHWLEKKEIKKSYSDFQNDVEALGSYFISQYERGTHIAVIGENSYEWLVTYFAAVNSGNVIVPLDKDASIPDIKHLIEKSNAEIIVHSDNYLDEVKDAGCNQLINMNSLKSIIQNVKEFDKTKYRELKINSKDMCTLVYTSGTTLEPKGVMLSHENIVFDTVATSKSVLIPDSSLVMLPIHHTYGFVASITIPMLIGSSIFINSSLKRLMSDISFAKPKYIACVPLVSETFYKKIQANLKETGKDKMVSKLVKLSDGLLNLGIDVRRRLFKKIIDAFGGNLEILVIGGAPINEKVVTTFHSFGVNVLCGYGITECSPIVSTMRNKHFDSKSVGVIHPGIEARIYNGEIQVKGPTVFKGYYMNDEATKAAFDGEWFKTGDLGKIENDMLYIIGRIKNLIILANGKNVSPEEIEQKLMNNIPEIVEVVVREENGIILAEIYSGDIDENQRKEIERKAFEYNKELPKYMQLGDVVFRNNEFPKTTTKKIKRSSSNA